MDIRVPAWDSLAAMQLKGGSSTPVRTQPWNSDVLLPLLQAVSSCHHLMAQVQMPDHCCNKGGGQGAAALGHKNLRLTYLYYYLR